MKDIINNLVEFIKKYKTAFIGSIIISLIVFGFRLTHYDISIDSEVYILDHNGVIESWYGIGRYSLGLLKTIFNFREFNYYLYNLVMIFLFPISMFILYYVINLITPKNKSSNFKILLFEALILTSPLYAEQFYFTLQCSEVSVGLLIFDIGSLLLIEGLKNNKMSYFIGTILCNTFCLGCYQAFAELMLLVVLLILIYYHDNNKVNKNIYFKLILVSVISFICYMVVSKLVQICLDVEASSYLTGQIMWLKSSFKLTIINVIKYIAQVVLGYGKLYNFGFMLAILIQLICVLKTKNKVSMLYKVLVLLVPLSLLLLLGNRQPYRAQFALPIVTSYILLFNTNFSLNKVKYLTLIYIFIIIGIQFKTTEDLFYSEYVKYTKEVYLTENIVSKLGDIEAKTLIFVGDRSFTKDKGEILGRSFYEFDKEGIIGSNRRIRNLFRVLGHDYVSVTLEEYQMALEEAKDMDVYPKDNSIKYIDDKIIIKLS